VCVSSTSPQKAQPAFSFANGSNMEVQSIQSGQLFREINNQVINSEPQQDDPHQVLIVDDDMFNLQILNDLIRIQLQVMANQACSGQIAIDIVKDKI
jgi:hypothetical protein